VWSSIFHLGIPASERVIRAVLIYAFMVVALRIVGKRELGQSNTLDLIVLLLVANAVQNGIIGNDNTVTGAVIAASTLFAVNEALNRAEYAFPWLSRVLEGDATLLIEKGKPVDRAIARRQGYSELGEVHTAILETNGTISMFKKDEPQIYHPAELGGLRIGKRRRSSH